MEAHELELQNFETRTAKLRDRGERFNLPVALIHEVDKLEVKMLNQGYAAWMRACMQICSFHQQSPRIP